MKNLLLDANSKKPIVHCITNVVTINDCANTILAFGGSPIMSSEKSEVKDLSKIANALYINIGTIKKNDIRCVFLAIKEAIKNNHPIVFDPVGCGASKFRTKLTKKIIEKSFRGRGVIKGNVSELRAILNLSQSHGVDANEGEMISSFELKQLNLISNKIILATGQVDQITDGNKIVHVKNGVSQLKTITGTGCILGALIATFCGVTENLLEASQLATIIIGISGELAKDSKLQNSFKVSFFNELSNINYEKINSMKQTYEK